ncbi:trypsin alpha-3-like [Leguminivora glycinivorella]|uniref:trypsin alpha-3-like n=1 Tax=Leguminivora glycinivorella TaxID=1035111 RepID=UPI00200D5990|nr:trypsin alpha-3-like [Leguminivora glycinivorella]
MAFDEYAKSIEPARDPPRNNRAAIIAGYGLNELNETLPRQGAVRIIKCPFVQTGRLLCSTSTVKSGPGDSGGALTSAGKLVGVVSGLARQNCDEYEQTDPKYPCTSVYVNVAAHYPWMKIVMGLKT